MKTRIKGTLSLNNVTPDFAALVKDRIAKGQHVTQPVAEIESYVAQRRRHSAGIRAAMSRMYHHEQRRRA